MKSSGGKSSTSTSMKPQTTKEDEDNIANVATASNAATATHFSFTIFFHFMVGRYLNKVWSLMMTLEL